MSRDWTERGKRYGGGTRGKVERNGLKREEGGREEERGSGAGS